MSEVLTFKRDPVWLETLALSARTEIIFQGVSSSDQVTVPAVILVAISPLVNSILAAVHMDPSFFPPVISIPSVTENGLQMSKEMLVSGIANMSNPTINEVMEVFKILGIKGDLTVVRAENDFNGNNSNGGDIVQRKTTGDPSNLNDIKPEHLISDDQTESEPGNIEIIIKLEKDHTIENSKSAYQIENKTNQKQVTNQLLKDCKRLRINVAKLTNSSEVDINDQTNNQTIKHTVEKERCLDDSTCEVTKKKSRNKNSTCHICHKEYASIKTLQSHINFFHMKKRKSCPHCNKMFNSQGLSRHIRGVHEQETAQCPYCDNRPCFSALNRHIEMVHKRIKCPHCEKKFDKFYLKGHIRKVHLKEIKIVHS